MSLNTPRPPAHYNPIPMFGLRPVDRWWSFSALSPFRVFWDTDMPQASFVYWVLDLPHPTPNAP